MSKGTNHLLKSPFCVHPKTGKICVPFDPEKVDKFDVDSVPTLTSVIKDIGSGSPKISSLEAPLMIFESFLKKLQKSENEKNL